jgi:2-dehydro-3-deoxygluconokinase
MFFKNTVMNKVVSFGELMVRLSAPDHKRFTQVSSFDVSFGGAEANVAVSLANLGIQTEYVTRLPKNDIGQLAVMELRRYNVGVNHILYGGDRIGIYFLEKGSVARSSKVLYDRANSSISEIKPGMVDWDKVFQGATWFHWTGITPAISESASETCLEAVKAAKQKGLIVSVDLNYRKNLWKWGKKAGEVMPGLVDHCDILLGNEEDAEHVFGIIPEGADISGGRVDASSYRPVCEGLKKKFPAAKKIIITLRGSLNADHNTWSGILFDGTRMFEAPVHNITHIVDRVGGGDSFMGGLIYGLINWPEDNQRALNFAVAASCLKHTIPGDFNMVSVAEVEQLMKGDSSGRVSR